MKSARKTIDDDPETAQLRLAVEEARAEVARGDVVPHEKVREWLLALAAGDRKAAPKP